MVLCSGLISIEEFRHTWRLFSAHLGADIDDVAIDDLARSIDFNKDGGIDFTEFLEAFRVVHKLDVKNPPAREKMDENKDFWKAAENESNDKKQENLRWDVSEFQDKVFFF